MADLKTTIAQTENLKNKVKLAKDRINQVVVRGGGITSKSLSEIPNNINKMLTDNYKKIAIFDNVKHTETYRYTNQDIPNTNTPVANTKIVISNINIDFIPKFFIMKMVVRNSGDRKDTTMCVDTRDSISAECSLYGGYEGTIFKENIIFNKKTKTITIYRYLQHMSDLIGIYDTDVIAIE